MSLRKRLRVKTLRGNYTELNNGERRAQEKLKEKKILQYAKHNSQGGIILAESDLGQALSGFDFKKTR